MDLVLQLRAIGFEVNGLSSKDLNIKNVNSVRERVLHYKPNIIIHSAAQTKVDQAEQEIDEAFAVNAYGTRNIAMAAKEIQAVLLYISTDYVFDGMAHKPYVESDAVNPQSIYGKSKLAGEIFVRQWVPEHYILRTSWLFGKHGANFVKSMLKLAEQRSRISVVCDQIGSPTYTVDLSKFIMNLLDQKLYGTYHVSNTGSCSWYEFSKEIFKQIGMNNLQVQPVTTAEFPRLAPRPPYSVMDHMGIRLNGLQDLRNWKEALSDYLLNP